MINFHKDHATLVNVALMGFVLLSTGVAVAPALSMQDNNGPLPDMPVMTAQEHRGLDVYVAEGCIACHTQQVRNIEMDKVWGTRPSMPSDYYYSKQRPNIWQNTPSLLGSERTGPDLTNVGVRKGSEAWQMLHLYDPRMVEKASIMPRYGWLFKEVDSTAVKPDDFVLSVPADKLDDATRARLEAQQAGSAYHLADGMKYDDVIDPRDLRNALLNGLALTAGRGDQADGPVRHRGILP